MLHKDERAETRIQAARFDMAFTARLQALSALVGEKAETYDNVAPVWHKMPFGVLSFTDEIYRKAARLISLVKANAFGNADNLHGDGGIEGSLMDLAAYALLALAWIDIGGED